ncbi:hypothetical protein [Methylocapsa sp. S129]|uniref:hypothetical protein n=1 Tax=Methylocapsa sp. S129 TaxID=1641869 RepID=UPI00131DF55D|nr:hypothetical protein [Methylocapsa sp. S129]
MIDIRQIIAGLARVTPAVDFPNANAIAAALSLEMAYASVANMKGGNLIVRGALLDDGTGIQIIAALSPRRELFLSFEDSRLPYRDIEGEVFGDDQHIQKSRASEGFAIVFYRDGLEFAITADSPDDVVDAIFCRTPNPRRQPHNQLSEQPARGTDKHDSRWDASMVVHAARNRPLISRETALEVARRVFCDFLGTKRDELQEPLLIEEDADVWKIRGDRAWREFIPGVTVSRLAVQMKIAKIDGAILSFVPGPM